MCWLSLGIAIVQIVIVTEWAIFEDPTLLEFVHFGEKYGWRCAPGHKVLIHFLTLGQPSSSVHNVVFLHGGFSSIVRDGCPR